MNLNDSCGIDKTDEILCRCGSSFVLSAIKIDFKCISEMILTQT
jgi:hypothetical protein